MFPGAWWRKRHKTGATTPPVPSGPANEIQTVTFSGGTPTGGTWSLTFDGETTTDLAFDVNAVALLAALEALSNIGSGNVAVSGSVGAGFTVEFQGTLANTNVPEMTVDASGLTQPAEGSSVTVLTDGADAFAGVAEVQTISYTADAGTWAFTGSIDNIAWDADPADVQGKLDGILGGGGIAGVTGSAGNYTITWVATGPHSLLSATWNLFFESSPVTGNVSRVTAGEASNPGANEVQVISLTGGATGGTWNCGGQVMSLNASAAQVETAVEAGTAAGVSVAGSDGGPWTVTWDDLGDQSLFTNVDTVSLTKGVVVTVETVQEGR